MSRYSVKEIFYSVQGEGAHTGRPSVFIRFAGCNLWSGREPDRSRAVCRFCDTDFVGVDGLGGGSFTSAEDLARTARDFWPQAKSGQSWVICTGGEPFLQLDTPLIDALHTVGFKIAVETNGTIVAPKGLDWICVSPKANAPLKQTRGDELKLVYPQAENSPDDFAHLDFQVFSLQPLADSTDDTVTHAHSEAALAYVLENPQWQLSLQTHKWLGVR